MSLFSRRIPEVHETFRATTPRPAWLIVSLGIFSRPFAFDFMTLTHKLVFLRLLDSGTDHTVHTASSRADSGDKNLVQSIIKKSAVHRY